MFKVQAIFWYNLQHHATRTDVSVKGKSDFLNFEKMILGWKILISISKSKNQNFIFCIKTFFSNYRKTFSIDPKFILKISEEPFCLELLNKAKIMSFERIDQNIFQIFYPPPKIKLLGGGRTL